jgi:HPt (histidine-containing phosphotransfer) domain-containing protein
MNARLLFTLLLILGALVPNFAFSQILVNKNTLNESLTHVAKFQKLPVSIADSEVLTGKYDAEFTSLDKNSFGFSKDSIWFKFDVENNDSVAVDAVLSFTYPLLDSVKIYYQSESAPWSESQLGDLTPHDGGKTTDISYDFHLEPGQKAKFYTRINSGSGLLVSSRIYSKAHHSVLQNFNLSFYSIFLGTLIGLGLYNLFLFFTTRFPHYFTYSILVFDSAAREAYLSGLSFQLLFHNAPRAHEIFGIVSMSMNVVTVNLFVLTFLKVKNASRGSYYYLVISTFLALLYLPLYLLSDYSTFIKPYALHVIITSVACVIISVIRYRQGFKIAKHFISAFWFVLMAWLVTAMSTAGIINASYFSQFANVVGQFIEIILLSFALSEFINQIKKEKNKAVVELNRLLQASVKEKTEDISLIMNNIEQGICLVRGGEEITISSDYSRYLSRIVLKDDLAGKNFVESIFEGSSIEGDRLNQLKSTLCSIMGESSLAFDMNSHLLVSEFQRRNSDGKEEVFTVQWTPVADEDDHIKVMLVVITNETNIRNLQLEAKSKQLDLKMLGELVSISETSFKSVVGNFRKLIQEIDDNLTKSDRVNLVDVQDLMRAVHTIKGMARTHGLTELATASHQAEDAILAQMRSSQLLLSKSLSTEIELIHRALNSYVKLGDDKLGRRQSTDRRNIVNSGLAGSCLLQLKEIEAMLMPGESSKAVTDIRNFLLKSVGNSLEDILREHVRSLASLAKELGKAPPQIHFDDPDRVLFLQHSELLLSSVFTHLMRNSVDHGIEQTEARTLNGKSPEGVITISIRQTPEDVQIELFDDGAGLDLSYIRQKAVEAGFLSDGKDLRKRDLAELVFESGISTAKTASEISGRGVGLYAVRSYLQREQGNIHLRFDPNARRADGAPIAFRFVISLPKSMIWNAHSDLPILSASA